MKLRRIYQIIRYVIPSRIKDWYWDHINKERIWMCKQCACRCFTQYGNELKIDKLVHINSGEICPDTKWELVNSKSYNSIN